MKMPIQKVKTETLRLKLHCPPDYLAMLVEAPEIVDEVTNGVGSETHWTYHITPDTVWGLNINPTSHAHDWMYTFPLVFPTVAAGLAWKLLADRYFKLNGQLQIDDGFCLLRKPRRARINTYSTLLNASGTEAFWANKPLPPDFDRYYSTRPSYDEQKVSRYMEIETTIKEVFPGGL